MFWTSFGGLCLYATEIACFGPDLVDYVYIMLLRLHVLDQIWLKYTTGPDDITTRSG